MAADAVPVLVRLDHDLDDSVPQLVVIWHHPDGARRLETLTAAAEELRSEAAGLVARHGMVNVAEDVWIRHPSSPRPDEDGASPDGGEASHLDPRPGELPRARRVVDLRDAGTSAHRRDLSGGPKGS